MRVMLFTHSYWPERTAPQRRWAAFVRVFRQEGWDVDVVAPHADPSALGPGAVPERHRGPFRTDRGPWGEAVRRVPTLPAPDTRAGRLVRHCASTLLSLPRALAAPRPDVVVATVPSLPTIAAGTAAAWLLRRPLVVEMRDAWPDLARESAVASSHRTRAFEWAMTLLQRRAHAVVTVTEGFRRVLQDRGVARAVCIPNGVSAAALPHVGPRMPHAGPLRVLYLGNHGESQGLETLIEAAAQAGGDVALRMVGQGTRKEALRRLAAARGADVEFLPPAHGREVDDHYSWADTCVVSLRPDWPSFEWTVPSKSYELVATGRHVTGIVRGEAARLLEDAGVADIVPPEAPAIAALWRALRSDPGRLAVHGGGRAWVAERAELSALAHGYLRELADVAEGGRRARRR